MCFSASASFISGVALVSTSAYLLSTKEIPKGKGHLAAIPLIFGLHQISEGFVWLGYGGHIPMLWQNIFILLFSFIATSFWPFYIPYAVYRYESGQHAHLDNDQGINQIFKMALLALVGLGFTVAAYHFWSSTINSSIVSQVQCSRTYCNSISYTYQLHDFALAASNAYLVVVALPFFLSRDAYVRYLVAPCFLLAFLIGSFLASIETFPSIWCFFAALMSTTILVAFMRKQFPSKPFSLFGQSAKGVA